MNRVDVALLRVHRAHMGQDGAGGELTPLGQEGPPAALAGDDFKSSVGDGPRRSAASGRSPGSSRRASARAAESKCLRRRDRALKRKMLQVLRLFRARGWVRLRGPNGAAGGRQLELLGAGVDPTGPLRHASVRFEDHGAVRTIREDCTRATALPLCGRSPFRLRAGPRPRRRTQAVYIGDGLRCEPAGSYAHNFGLGPNTGVLARGPGDRRSAHSLGLRRFSVFRLAAPTRLPRSPP